MPDPCTFAASASWGLLLLLPAMALQNQHLLLLLSQRQQLPHLHQLLHPHTPQQCSLLAACMEPLLLHLTCTRHSHPPLLQHLHQSLALAAALLLKLLLLLPLPLHHSRIQLRVLLLLLRSHTPQHCSQLAA
jgi:hypothetical protein